MRKFFPNHSRNLQPNYDTPKGIQPEFDTLTQRSESTRKESRYDFLDRENLIKIHKVEIRYLKGYENFLPHIFFDEFSIDSDDKNPNNTYDVVRPPNYMRPSRPAPAIPTRKPSLKNRKTSIRRNVSLSGKYFVSKIKRFNSVKIKQFSRNKVKRMLSLKSK